MPIISALGVIINLTTYHQARTDQSSHADHHWAQDVTTQGAGTMLGITNSCGVVMGILGNLATGWAVDATGSYCLVFGALAALYATSWALFASTLKGEPIRLSMA